MFYNRDVRSLYPEFLRLRDEVEQSRLDFIKTDLEVLLTFATIVETESDMCNREHAKHTLAEAEKGYSELSRFFAQSTGLTPEVEGQLRSKFTELRERLDGLQRLG